jgi:hypothetical protein
MMPLNGYEVAPSDKSPLYLRWWGLLWGIITFFWLPIEDITITFLVVVALGWCAWLGSWAAWRGLLLHSRRRLVWLGGGAGLLFFPLASAFILFKAGLHAHGFLDFSLFQITRLAWLTPVWVVVGGLVGGVVSRASLDM